MSPAAIAVCAYFFLALCTALAYHDPRDRLTSVIADGILGLLWPIVLTTVAIRRLVHGHVVRVR